LTCAQSDGWHAPLFVNRRTPAACTNRDRSPSGAGFQRYHCSNPAFANRSQQSLESRPDRPATGSTEIVIVIVIDDLNIVPAGGSAAMSDMNRSFSGSMPEFYDRFLVPVMFEPFACDLASRLKELKSGLLLELAAGTGVVTRAMTEALPREVQMTATDLNPAMLDQAKSHAGLERVTWREADALALPFSDGMFDCVVCQFGVMFFPDKGAGFREAFRVLRPGGQLIFNVWGDREDTVQQLISVEVGRLLSRDPATLLAPEYNEIEMVKAELTGAGFGQVVAENVVKSSHFNSARDAAISSCHGGLLRAQIERHAPERLEEITDSSTAVISARYGNGQIDAPLRAIVFTAHRPVD
jgi:SAM-dependent methyltransferase